MAQEGLWPRSSSGTDEASAQEIHEVVTRVEESADLLRHTLDGWSVWPVLRNGVMARLAAVRPTRAARSRVVLRAALMELPALARLPRASLLAKTPISHLREGEGDGFKDVFVDDAVREVGDFVKLDSLNAPAFVARRSRAVVRAAASTSAIEVAAAALAISVPVPRIRRLAERIGSDLRAGGGIETDSRWIERQLLYFHWLRRAYGPVFRRVRPRAVLVTTIGEHAFVAAARETGARVIEYQHGISDRYHRAYSWTEYASYYKQRMPIPQHIFLFGEHWREELAYSGFWGDELCVVGSTRIDEYRARRRQRNPSVAPRVVWTTQGVAREESIRFMAEFLRSIPGSPLELFVRLHPGYDRDPVPYRRAFGDDPRVTIEAAEDAASLFERLALADLHVSISSASHYDALGLGVPTAILPLANHDLVGHLAEAGHGVLLASPKQLASVVLDRETAVETGIGERYYRSNARSTIARILRSIIGC